MYSIIIQPMSFKFSIILANKNKVKITYMHALFKNCDGKIPSRIDNHQVLPP